MSRTKIRFDDNWIFKNKDIAIPYAIKAGRTGMPTDVPDKLGGAWLANKWEEEDPSIWHFEEWETVTLPHDWAIYKEYDPTAWFWTGFIKPGIGCYRKTFSIPAEYEGKKITVNFDGVSKNCTVWLNGFLIGSHFSGYTPFSFDLSSYLRYGEEGENVLFLKVDAREPEGWWYEGAGIYRHVYLTVTEPVHIEQYGVFITTETATQAQAEVRVETNIFNESTQATELTVRTTLRSHENEVVACCEETVSVDAEAHHKVLQKLTVTEPALWDVDSPYLYTAQSQLLADGEELDCVYNTVGIRTIAFKPEGFYLNGKHLTIKGVCCHQDFGGVGVALPDSIHEYKISRLKEMGANAYRCAHHPPAPELLDACDRFGILVMDENRKLDATPMGTENLEAMVLRDRNHPSVIMWCTNNEETLLGTKTAKRIETEMRRIIKKLDPTRPTVSAMQKGWNENDYDECIDIVGYNYGHREDQYFKDAVDYPDRLMIITEATASCNTRGVYHHRDRDKGYFSSFETEMENGTTFTISKKAWQDLLKCPRLTGIFAWSGFDYRGEPDPIQWPGVHSHWGMMDMGGIPKDVYYYYKAVWKDEPTIHLFPHWNHTPGEEVPVRVFTNCDSYELVLNGRSLGEHKVEDISDYQDQTVTFEAGTLTAIGKKGRKEVCRKSVTTAGKAAKIQLIPHKHILQNDGEDAIVVHAGIFDRDGIPVPDASDQIHFCASGGAKVIGVCNGDACCHEPDKATERSAFNGWCTVIIQSVKDGGTPVLEAAADGLAGDVLKLEQ